jgi:hypothetical protein
MRSEYVKSLKKQLPKFLRIIYVASEFKGLPEILIKIHPPDKYHIQVAPKLDIFGRSKLWITIGELDMDEDIVFLSNQYYRSYLPQFTVFCQATGLNIPIRQGTPFSTLRYYQRVERLPLKVTKAARVSKYPKPPSHKEGEHF